MRARVAGREGDARYRTQRRGDEGAESEGVAALEEREMPVTRGSGGGQPRMRLTGGADRHGEGTSRQQAVQQPRVSERVTQQIREAPQPA